MCLEQHILPPQAVGAANVRILNISQLPSEEPRYVGASPVFRGHCAPVARYQTASSFAGAEFRLSARALIKSIALPPARLEAAAKLRPASLIRMVLKRARRSGQAKILRAASSSETDRRGSGFIWRHSPALSRPVKVMVEFVLSVATSLCKGLEGLRDLQPVKCARVPASPPPGRSSTTSRAPDRREQARVAPTTLGPRAKLLLMS